MYKKKKKFYQRLPIEEIMNLKKKSQFNKII